MIDAHLHLRRRHDSVEVVTLEDDMKHYRRVMKPDFTPVRYIKSGRKGYIKDNDLEADFVVVGKLNAKERWSHDIKTRHPGAAALAQETAAALEDLREKDIHKLRKWILDNAKHPDPKDQRSLRQLDPSIGALARLEEAIHMILAGV